MKTVLCFGDSNTWGFCIERFLAGDMVPRFPAEQRWTGVAAAALGDGYHLIEEGLNGRTTVFDDPVSGAYKNGSRYLLACLESHAPLDLVVIMLGTNDVKDRFSAPAADIARGAATLAATVRSSESGPRGAAPAVLLVSPLPVGEHIRQSPFGEEFGYERGREKSLRFPERYANEAKMLGVDFLDAAKLVSAHPLDSIHLSAESHAVLGKAIAARIEGILGA